MPRLEVVGLGIYFVVGDYTGAPGSSHFIEPLDEFAVTAEFSEKFSTYNKPPASLLQPFVEEFSRVWAVVAKNLVSDVVIHDSAHTDYRPIDRRISSMKNRL